MANLTAADAAVIAALLTGGSAAFVAIAKAVREWREGTWRHRGGEMDSLDQRAKDFDADREWEAAQRVWWQNWAGTLEHLIRARLGADVIPIKEPFPERHRAEARR